MNEVSELRHRHIVKACQKYNEGRCALGDYIIILVSERSKHQWCGDISMSM